MRTGNIVSVIITTPLLWELNKDVVELENVGLCTWTFEGNRDIKIIMVALTGKKKKIVSPTKELRIRLN